MPARRRAELDGTELTARFRVSDATASRDLKFIGRLRWEFAEMIGPPFGGFELCFEMRNGVRVR